MSSSKETNVRKWDFENTKLFYEVLQGKFPENYPIHCDLKLTPEQAFDVIYILQEYFNAIPDVFEQCYRCKELYDSDCGGNHYNNVGINLCEWCEDHILYREGYGGDYETLDEYVEKWFKSTKSDRIWCFEHQERCKAPDNKCKFVKDEFCKLYKKPIKSDIKRTLVSKE